MQNIKKRTFWLLAIIGLLFVITGCSKSGNDDLEKMKISFANTIDKLNVFLQLYNSNMLTKTKDGYSIEFSKEKIESDIEGLKKAEEGLAKIRIVLSSESLRTAAAQIVLAGSTEAVTAEMIREKLLRLLDKEIPHGNYYCHLYKKYNGYSYHKAFMFCLVTE